MIESMPGWSTEDLKYENTKDVVEMYLRILGNTLVYLGFCKDSPCSNSGATFENDVFSMRAYNWGDCIESTDGDETDGVLLSPSPECNCPSCAPNFIHYPSEFSASWYKYVGRGFQCDDINFQKIFDIFKECYDSLERPKKKPPNKDTYEEDFVRGIFD